MRILQPGDIEVIAKDIRILAEADTPPFPIEENSKTKEDLRLKYRYLDLRRPDLQKNIMMRSKVTTLVRSFMAEEGFIEIETPTLVSQLRKARVITLYQAAYIRVSSMHCHSHHRFTSSF